jgi:uncharacterized protein (TIGR03435 family)
MCRDWSMRLRAFVVLCGLLGAIGAARAQAPRFEVATVKLNRSGDLRAGLRLQPGGSFIASNEPLPALLEFAFGYPPSRITGLTGWALSERFDIAAKADPAEPLSQAGFAAMVRTLLVDRFGLKTHTETRDAPVYELRLERADGRADPRLIENTREDCRRLANGEPPPQAPPAAGGPRCGGTMSAGFLGAVGLRMTQLATTLTRLVDRPVVDRTGLTGVYDFELTFRPEQSWWASTMPLGIDRLDPNAPSIFVALREQLGLKLEPARDAVDMLVIDAIARPTTD